jgi:hypothetical protein
LAAGPDRRFHGRIWIFLLRMVPPFVGDDLEELLSGLDLVFALAAWRRADPQARCPSG